jgi:hypothetical protein
VEKLHPGVGICELQLVVANTMGSSTINGGRRIMFGLEQKVGFLTLWECAVLWARTSLQRTGYFVNLRLLPKRSWGQILYRFLHATGRLQVTWQAGTTLAG